MKMTFYTPFYQGEATFGGATFGFAGAEDETLCRAQTYSEDLCGTVICGSYSECLENIPKGSWQAGVVLLGNAGNENAFIHALAEKTGAPLVGGSAAINPKTGESGLITGRGEAAIFLIDDDRYDITAVCENVHHDILSEHTISFSGRYIDTIDGIEALMWFNQQKEKFSLAPEDFEHLTLADGYGINAHLSEKEGRLFSGRDLAETMYLRHLPKDKAQERIQSFYDDENAIIFGCAGLKQTLSAGLSTKGLGLFMFGEVCTVNGHSDFGNLMLSKLQIRKK